MADFYGWRLLAVAGFCAFMSGPGQTSSVSAFIDPYIEAFDISRLAQTL